MEFEVDQALSSQEPTAEEVRGALISMVKDHSGSPLENGIHTANIVKGASLAFMEQHLSREMEHGAVHTAGGPSDPFSKDAAKLHAYLLETLEELHTREQELNVVQGELEVYRGRYDELSDMHTQVVREHLEKKQVWKRELQVEREAAGRAQELATKANHELPISYS